MFAGKICEGEEIIFLTPEHINFCHEKALTLHPDNLTGTKNVGAIQSAINRAEQFHYYEQEHDLVRLAAVIWHGLGRAHGYNDANKRTAFISAFTFLEMNGVEVSAPADEPGRFTNALFELDEQGKDQFEIERLEGYLRSRSRWIEAE